VEKQLYFRPNKLILCKAHISAERKCMQMNRFLPREKMGKREKRALDKAKRQVWGAVSPVTRTTENKKGYNRKRSPRWYDDDSTGTFICRFSAYSCAFSSCGSL
jgi:hypothetical protein